MSRYDELMHQAKALMAQAEQARKAELADVIADIKVKMKQFGITISDLGCPAAQKKSSTSSREAKYKGPNGELWGGGAGRKPGWVRAVLASGGDLERYRI